MDTTTALITIGTTIAGTTIIGIGYTIGTYNTLQAYQQDIKEMLGNISAEYQRRLDLFLRLAESVKSMKKQEKEVLTEVTKLRSGLKQKTTPEKKIKTIKQIDTILNGLKINVEAYPNLTTADLHKDLMKEIRITEDRINIARTSYNETINYYNTTIVSFPSNIIADIFKFRTWEYYLHQDKQAEQSPKLAL